MQSDIPQQIRRDLFQNLKLDELFQLSLTLFREVTHRSVQTYVPGIDTNSKELIRRNCINCVYSTSQGVKSHTPVSCKC